MAIHPYLFFTNTARTAMTRYHEILGGELEIMGVDEMPPGEAEQMPFEAPEGFVMHAALILGDDLIMASDDPTGDGGGVKGMAISYSTTDADEVRRIFGALSEGGVVDMPLGPTFWSPLFGSCVDEFGVSWMVGVDAEEA